MSWSDLVTMLHGGVVTLEVTAVAWLIAMGVGLALAVLRDRAGRGVGYGIEFLVTILRGAPQLVAAYLIFFGLGEEGIQVQAFLAAVIAIGLTTAGFSAEYFRGVFSGVGEGQREAARALGLGEFAVMMRIVFRQAIPVMIPIGLNEFVSLLKVAVLASAIGVPEILYRSEAIMTRTGEIMDISVALLAIYLIFTVPINQAVGVLERRIRNAARSSDELTMARF